ncbi:MAG: hypothetical protein AB7W06_17385 [Alphaproteobacteria bacterium]
MELLIESQQARSRALDRVIERCRDGRASVFRCRGKLFVVAPANDVKDLIGERGADALISLTVDDI